VYDLPVDTIDLLEHVTRTGTGQNQQDLTITRISVSTYATIPNKNATGRPIQVWVDRQSGATYPAGGRPQGTDPITGIDNPKIYVWPAPDQGSEEDPYYKKSIERVEFNCTFDEIPINERLLRFFVPRNEEYIQKMYERIELCRQWLIEFDETYKNLNAVRELSE
jgi:hypothetical protein